MYELDGQFNNGLSPIPSLTTLAEGKYDLPPSSANLTSYYRPLAYVCLWEYSSIDHFCERVAKCLRFTRPTGAIVHRIMIYKAPLQVFNCYPIYISDQPSLEGARSIPDPFPSLNSRVCAAWPAGSVCVSPSVHPTAHV